MKRARSRLGLLLVLGMLTALLPIGAVAPAGAVDLHVSEFHYDNSGGDVGEFIEVTGDAGTDLTGWTIELYNGSGGVVLMPVLLHVGWNFWSGAFGQEASAVLLPLFLLTAICVSLLTKGKLGLPASPNVPETRLQQAN